MNLWTSIPRSPALTRWALALAIVALTGCNRDEVRVYRVAKEELKPAARTTAHNHDHDGGGGGIPHLEYTVPAGWEELTPGEMRLASFKVVREGQQADIGVFPLPGLAGGDLGNVNRWRSQVGLPAIDEAELEKTAETVAIGEQTGKLYDLAGENPNSGDATRVLGAILHREGVAWFFKMNGDDQLVASQKQPFVDFLKSLQFKTAGAQMPPDHPPVDGVSMAAQVASTPSGQAKPTWEVPSTWTESSPGPFLIAKFNIPGDEKAPVAVNVSMSAGDGGGLAGNVNRWRKQLGLGELSEADLKQQIKTVETTSGSASFVEMSGTDPKTGQPTGLIGAVVSQPGRTWFYKLMGGATVVAREKDSFTQFVKTAKYPNAS